MRKHTADDMGKSGQIRDTKPKTGQMGVPSLKIETVPENPGRMVTLPLGHFPLRCSVKVRI